MLGEFGEEVDGFKQMEIFFEILRVGCVEQHAAFERFVAYLQE